MSSLDPADSRSSSQLPYQEVPARGPEAAISLAALTSRILDTADPVTAFASLVEMDRLRLAAVKDALTTLNPAALSGVSDAAFNEVTRRVTTGALLRFAREEPEVVEVLREALASRTKRPNLPFAIMAELSDEPGTVIDAAELGMSTAVRHLRNGDRPDLVLREKILAERLTSFPIGGHGLERLTDELAERLAGPPTEVTTGDVLLARAMREKYSLLEEELTEFAGRCAAPRADILLTLADTPAVTQMIEGALRSEDPNLNYAALRALSEGSEYTGGYESEGALKDAFMALAAKRHPSAALRKLIEDVAFGYGWKPADAPPEAAAVVDPAQEAMQEEFRVRDDAENARYLPYVKQPNRLLDLPRDELLTHVSAYEGTDYIELGDQLEALFELGEPYADDVLPMILKAVSRRSPIGGYDSASSGRSNYYDWKDQVADLLEEAPYLSPALTESIARFLDSTSSICVSGAVYGAIKRFGLGSEELARVVSEESLWCEKTPFFSGPDGGVGIDRLTLSLLHSMGLHAASVVPTLALRTLTGDSVDGLQALAVIDNVRALQGEPKASSIDLEVLPPKTRDTERWSRNEGKISLSERLLVSSLFARTAIDDEVLNALVSVVDRRAERVGYLASNFGGRSFDGAGDDRTWFFSGASLAKPQVLFPVVASFPQHCEGLVACAAWSLENYFHDGYTRAGNAPLDGKMHQVDTLLQHLPCSPTARRNLAKESFNRLAQDGCTATEALIAARVAKEGSVLHSLALARMDQPGASGNAIAVALPAYSTTKERILGGLRSSDPDTRFTALYLLGRDSTAALGLRADPEVGQAVASFTPRGEAETKRLEALSRAMAETATH